MRFTTLDPKRLAPALAGLLLLAGCSRTLLTAPGSATEPGVVVEPAASAAVVVAPPPPSLLGSVLSPVDSLINWVPVVQKLVRRDEDVVVTGHRWSLHFEKGSLDSDQTITIKDYDANVLDVQFGPHGTKFPVPVTLSIDFSNTDADPGLALSSETPQPVLYWLNERTNKWEEVPGQTDWANKRHVVRLEHFSRYVLGGKAGWKHQPQQMDE